MTEKGVDERRHLGAERDIGRKKGVVNQRQTTHTKDISSIVVQLEGVVTDLQQRMQRIEAAVFSNSTSKAKKLLRIAELTDLNEQVTVTAIKSEFKIRATNYARDLLKEAAEAHNLFFVKGSTGQESFVSKIKTENKPMHAYAEVYRDLISKPIGTTITESAIAHKYDLNGQELQSVICHLARHAELHIVLPMNRKGCRRVKRVR